MRSGELMIVLIVLIFAVSRVMQSRYGDGNQRFGRGRRGNADRDRAPPPGDADRGEADRLRGEVRMLQDRIQVLERIVTDGDRNRSIALEQEIESLRDRAAIRRQEAE